MTSIVAELRQSAMSTPEARRGTAFAFAFLVLGVVSFAVSEASTALVLQLNSFQLVYRALCTLAQFSCRQLSTPRPALAQRFPYGLSRLDTLIQYAAASFLLFAALSVIVEAIHHLLEAHDTEPVLVEVICSIHMALIVAFTWICRPEVRFMGSSESLWMFFFFECRAPLISFASCALVTMFDAPRIDVLSAVMFALTCISSAWRHVSMLTPVLLLQAPQHDHDLADAMRQVSLVSGVIRLSRVQTWLLRPDAVGIFVKADVEVGTDLEETAMRIRRLLSRVCAECAVELEPSCRTAPRGTLLDESREDAPSAFPSPPTQLQFPV